jgi:hypothetical protein
MSPFKHLHGRLKWIVPAYAGLFLLGPVVGNAQDVTYPNNTLPPQPATSVQPAPAVQVPSSAPCAGDADGFETSAGGEHYGVLDVIAKSVCGKLADSSNFVPLGLYNFGQGWLEPYIPPGDGSSGAERGGWVNTLNGFLLREIDPGYSHTVPTHGGPTEDIGNVTLFVPLSQRLGLSIQTNYVDSLGSTGATRGATSYGDTFITPEVMLIETKDFGLQTGVTFRVPTGETKTGNDLTSVTPYTAFWADLGHAWQARGGITWEVPTNNEGDQPASVLNVNLAFGKTLFEHTSPILPDFTPYVSFNYFQDFGHGLDSSEVTVTPGLRTYLGWNSYLIMGCQVPITGPRPYDQQWTFVLIHGF